MSQQQPKSQLITQFVENLVKFNPKATLLKKGAKIPEIRVQESPKDKIQTYALIGDRYIIGRSSRNSDIKVLNPIVSQVHCSLHRDQKNPRHFVIKDENSTNGIYLGRRRIKKLSLRDGDTITFGPPELNDVATLSYYNPPPIWMQWLGYGFYGMGSLLTLIIFWLLWETSKINVRPLPSGVSGPVVVYARDGQTSLSPVSDDTHYEIKRLKDFSPYLSQAVIASEDSRFYWHFGVDPYGILRAVIVNLKDDEIRQGASTLTQQLARSLFPEVGRENTAQRKIREMIVALKLEAVYSKREILKTYLNRVYLGLGNYGFENAAQFYFDKSATEVNIAEAATLVAMLPAPNLYNPVQDYDTSVQLRNRVITRMAGLNMISSEEAARARRSRIEISPQARKSLANSQAPYFYAYVFEELRRLLGTEIAKEGNFIVETGLDLEKQKTAEKKLQEAVKTQGLTSGFSQGAMVTLDTRTGEIVALVGGVDYKQSQFNRTTQAKRQPGSTFKIFAYAAALEKGISPAKSYPCQEMRWQGRSYKSCERSSGEVNMYQGMAQSENTIALQIAKEAGLNRVVDLAQRLGVKSELEAVPGLVLGQSEVTVLEMTGAYAALANNGVWNRPHAIRRILDGGECTNNNDWRTCREIYRFPGDSSARQQVLSPQVTQTMTTMLREVVSSGTGRAASLGLGEAGKTGTTDRAVDLWFIGYLPHQSLATGIWLGNDDNSPTKGSSSQAAALWGNYHRD